MKKKTYSIPVSTVVTIPPIGLLDSSTSYVPYDSDGMTEEALTRPMDY